MNKTLALLCMFLAFVLSGVSQQASGQTSSTTSRPNACAKFIDIGAEKDVCVYHISGSATVDVDLNTTAHKYAQILFVTDSPNITVSVDPAAKDFPSSCPKDPFRDTPHGKKAGSVLTGPLVGHPDNTSCPYTFSAVAGDGSADPTLIIH